MLSTIRQKIIALIIAAIIISVLAVEALTSAYIRNTEESDAKENIILVCESGVNSINIYSSSIEQTVQSMAKIISHDLNKRDLDMHQHFLNMADTFSTMARNTRGVLTFYYRLDENLYDETGFWYYITNDGIYKNMELTRILDYDEDDYQHVGWFYIPKKVGKGVWISPYYNETIQRNMMSYVVPLYYENSFIGVVGIDISYDVLVSLLKDIKIYNTGYAILLDSDNRYIYNPHVYYGISQEEALADAIIEETPIMPDDYFIYTIHGIKHRAISRKLHNNMKLIVTVDDQEIVNKWKEPIISFNVIALASLFIFVLIAWVFADRITRPLHNLTLAAQEVDKGNYDVELSYKGTDEVAILTDVFNKMAQSLKEQFGALSDKAYTDDLTNVKNKSSFSVYSRKFDIALKGNEPDCEKFAVCMFDCNNLKEINDVYGHEKGDIYLISACQFICRIFAHSPVFRIGGDEFSVIVSGEDYENMGTLMEKLVKETKRVNEETEEPWRKINFASGFAFFDRELDNDFSDVLRRADRNMYEDKHTMKMLNKNS